MNLAELTKDKPVPQKAELYSAVDMVFGRLACAPTGGHRARPERS